MVLGDLDGRDVQAGELLSGGLPRQLLPFRLSDCYISRIGLGSPRAL